MQAPRRAQVFPAPLIPFMPTILNWLELGVSALSGPLLLKIALFTRESAVRSDSLRSNIFLTESNFSTMFGEFSGTSKDAVNLSSVPVTTYSCSQNVSLFIWEHIPLLMALPIAPAKEQLETRRSSAIVKHSLIRRKSRAMLSALGSRSSSQAVTVSARRKRNYEEWNAPSIHFIEFCQNSTHVCMKSSACCSGK